jgi:hypothetical protein
MACQPKLRAGSTHALVRADAMEGILRSDPTVVGSERRLVGSPGNAPVRRFRLWFSDTRFTVGQPDHFPENWEREWESHPPEEVYEASLCALVEFPAVNSSNSTDQ